MGSRNIRLRTNNYIVFVVFGLLAILICVATIVLVLNTTQGERKIPVAGDIPGTTVQTLVELEGSDAYPESILVGDDDFLYSGSFCTGELWRISPQGELEVFLPPNSGIQAVSGMAFGSDGALYVVDRGSCDPTRGSSSLKRVLPDGTVENWGQVTEDELLNDITFDANGLLYATDSQLGEVRTYNAEGVARVWWDVPSAPNKALPTGIAYDRARDAILVADSNNGKVYAVPITEEASPGEYDVLYQDDSHALDGLTLDAQGRVILTIYDISQVVRLEDNGVITVLAQNFREPSDVAYLDGKIYVTNFDSISLTPLLKLVLDPSLPFTIDVIELPDTER